MYSSKIFCKTPFFFPAVKSRQTRVALSRIQRSISNRRYHQAFVQCLCEINSVTGEREKGSCFAAYKGNISIQFTNVLARFYPSKCICQLDWVSKTLWPCFPRKLLFFPLTTSSLNRFFSIYGLRLVPQMYFYFTASTFVSLMLDADFTFVLA